MHKIVRLAGAVTALTLIAAACSSGSSDSSSKTTTQDSSSNSVAAASSGTGGLPQRAEPIEVANQANTATKGKKARLVLAGGGALLTDQWTNSLKAGFEQNGMTFDVADAQNDASTESQMLETAINEKVDVLVVQNGDLTSLADLLKKAQDQGIYVAVLNLGSNQQTDAFVGPDWNAMGEFLATKVSDDCTAAGQKNVAIITGLGSDTGSVLMSDSMTRVFKERGMNVVANQPGQYDPNKAREITATLLQQYPELCAIAGNWDGMMVGAAAAVGTAGRTDVGVYTTDSSMAACDAIRKGEMKAAVNYGVVTMGPTIVSLMSYLLQGGITPGSTRTALFTPLSLVDKTNVDAPGACYDGKG